ncbi:MAG: hypothetical protein ACLVK5_00255 [Peptoniphilus senegalensis]
MIFKVKRSSIEAEGILPIKESFKGKCLETQCLLFPSFEAFEEKNNCSFKAMGMNHRVLPDKTIARDFEIDCYLIEINTLEELMKLEDKYGSLIVMHLNYNYPVLEIYDTWRE